MKKISIKGILLGCLAVVVIDLISGVAIALMLVEDFSEEAFSALETQTNYLLFGLIIGTLSVVVGGYIAAKISKTSPYLNSAFIALIGIVIGLLIGSGEPLWFDVAGYASIIPAALLGGHLASIKKTENV